MKETYAAPKQHHFVVHCTMLFYIILLELQWVYTVSTTVGATKIHRQYRTLDLVIKTKYSKTKV